MIKTLRYGLEALGLCLLLLLFRGLPAQTASRVGGWLGRTIGPRLAASRKARKNLLRAFPDLPLSQQNETLSGMWENLGRLIAEYPHLATLARAPYTQITGAEHLRTAQAQGRGVVCFGGHLGNWEINSAACLIQLGLPVEISYRAPNNPWTDSLLMQARTLHGHITAHAKSKSGGKAMMNAVRHGHVLGILIDQKYNQGLCVPFFGLPAMTNPFFVQLCQKYDSALIPIRGVRLHGATFRLEIHPPLSVMNTDGTPRPVEDIVAEAHTILEGWITQTPEQWLWLHRRWKDTPHDNTAL